jgi:hypothetical protein
MIRPMLLFPALIFLAIGLIIFSMIQANRRREALFTLATELGLQFDPAGGRAHDHFEGFLPFGRGSSRRSDNLLHGVVDGTEWMIFDYKYTTGSGDDETTHHHSIVSATLPITLPALTIRPEGMFDKLAGLMGFDDINFESEAFSRRYHVSCDDRKTCYDVIHPQMIEFLMAIDPIT